MQKHWLPLLSIMLLLGLSATGRAAVTDATGDQFVAGKDLLWADALFYPPTPLPVADWVRLTVTMNTGSTLPGMIVWDIDADNNAATGGSSFLNMPFSPCPAGGCKTERGFDFYVLLVLRDQGDAGHTAYCAGCEDYESNCARRGNPVECLEGICFEPGEMCYNSRHRTDIGSGHGNHLIF